MPGCRRILGSRAGAACHGRAALSKEKPVDIAFVCMKSYDTAWATTLIQQYLAPDAYVVSLQNCINEETIAGIVGWGKTLGCIACRITVNLVEPGHIHRGSGKGGAATRYFGPAKRMAVSHLVPRRFAGWSATPTARKRPATCGVSAGRNWCQCHRKRAVRMHGLHRRRGGAQRADPAVRDPVGSEAIRVGQRWAMSSRKFCICRRRLSRGPGRATRRRCAPATSNA